MRLAGDDHAADIGDRDGAVILDDEALALGLGDDQARAVAPGSRGVVDREEQNVGDADR